jgi:glycine cleavage system H protein
VPQQVGEDPAHDDRGEQQQPSHIGSNASGSRRLALLPSYLTIIGVVQPLKFSGAHVWVRVDGSDAVLGLSDYLQDQMGEITTLELPDLGDVLRATRRMGHVESEEASSPIEAPITGEVLEVNAEAIDNPDLINTDPYGAGWLLRVRIENPGELEDLINEEEYAELTTEV